MEGEDESSALEVVYVGSLHDKLDDRALGVTQIVAQRVGGQVAHDVVADVHLKDIGHLYEGLY